MRNSNFHYDQDLIRELRKAALDGAHPVALIGLILKREGYAHSSVVPVLAYLRRAFCVPLHVVLPLREEMGVGPASRALRVVFWFAATMLANEDYAPWDWQMFQETFKNGFSAEDMIPWPTGDESMKLEHCKTSDGLFSRGVMTIFVDDQEALDVPDEIVRTRIRAFADHHRQMSSQSSNGKPGDYLTRLTFEFQLDRDGPKCRVICMVRTLKEQTGRKQQPSLASV